MSSSYRPAETVASVASRPMRRLRVACTAACASGLITPTTGTVSVSWRSGSAGRGRGVARDDDDLHALRLEVRPDLEREAADLLQRPRPVGQARAVAEVDEVLVRHRHEALVEDRQPSHARVEDADRPGIHAAILRAATLGR